MKYKKQLFDYAVKDYMRTLKDYKYKSVVIFLDIENEHAFFSIAPLAQALHELHSDVYLTSIYKGKSIERNALEGIWQAHKEHTNNKRGKNTKYISRFLKILKDKSGKDFTKLFRPANLVIKTTKTNFTAGKLTLPYKYKWFKSYKAPQLSKAVVNVWKNVFALKKKEQFEINLPLIPPENILKLPIEDYMDSYPIVWNLIKAGIKAGGTPIIKSQTDRVSPVEPSEHIGDLLTTLYGCEYSKEIKDPIFKEYKEFSKVFKLNNLKPAQARLVLHTQGFAGLHRFGQKIGYPTPDKKHKWLNPKSMFLKMEHYAQSHFDPRKPLTRVALTETLPIDVFVETVNIDYKKLRSVTGNINKALKGCLLVNVISNEKEKEHMTNLVVDVGERRFIPDDADATTLYDKEAHKRTKKYFGNYVNIPSGEVFITPESMQGKFVGDVVISVDRSIMLSETNPVVVEVEDGHYSITKAPERVLESIEKTKQDQMKILLEQEKNKSIPQTLINQKKANFDRIGEFAINTHPTARLCEYLVVNEKIARMIHIALGSGFENDRNTVYHFDIVINAAKQKLDIYGVKPNGEKVWVLRKGRFAI